MRSMIRKVERQDGTKFQVYGRSRGRKVYVGTYDSKRKAEEEEEDHRVTQRKIRDGELPPEMDANETIAEAAERWLAELEQRGARSHTAYAEFMRGQIIPILGNVQVARLTMRGVISWQTKVATEYSPATVNAALGCLSSMMTDLLEGSTTKNPCHGVERLEVKEKSYLWIRTVPEIERLIANCTDYMRELVALAVGTGMRIDELLHLQWVDVDLERRLVTIQRGRKGTPKGGMRRIPILDSALSVLSVMAVKRGGAILVFPSTVGKVRHKQDVGKSFKRALGHAGLDRAIRFHDLRHTFASHWVMNGGDIFRLSKVLGHRDVSVTQRTYAHLSPEVWQQDYARVAFRVPSEARVLRFKRGNG